MSGNSLAQMDPFTDISMLVDIQYNMIKIKYITCQPNLDLLNSLPVSD